MFGLTGMTLLITSAALLVVVVLIAVIVLPRRRRPGVWKYIEQALAVVLAMGLALSTVFLLLNRSNHWYGSWGDLTASSELGTVSTTSFGAPLAQSAEFRQETGGDLTALQTDPRSNSALGHVDPQDSDGQWLEVTIGPMQGSKTDLRVSSLVWLPPGYVEDAQRSYPVLVAFPGVPGSITTYRDDLGIDGMVRSAVDSGSMQAPIIVVPGVFPNNQDTECMDGAAGPWETWTNHDLRQWISTHLRPVADRQAWAVTGYSAGGWCSAMMAVRHPDHFGWGISLSGYFSPTNSAGGPVNNVDDPRYQLADIAQQKRPDIGLWVFAAGQDAPAVAAVEQFAPHVSSPTSLVSVRSEFGGHRTASWVQPQQESLAWLGQVSPWFAPKKP